MGVDKKLKRQEKKKKKLVAEYDLAKSNDAVKRPAQLAEAGPTAAKKERIELSVNTEIKLSDEDFKKLKKELAERKKFLTQLPRFGLQYAGVTATFGTDYTHRIPLLMYDVQHLLVYSLCGNSFTTPPHRWCSIQKSNRLTNIVTLVVEGVTSSDFLDYEHVFTKLTEHFPDRLEVTAPSHYGSTTDVEFSAFPVSAAQKEHILKKFGSLEAALDSKQIVKSFRALFPITSEEKGGKSESEVDPESSVIGLDVSIPPVLPQSDMFPRTHLLLSIHQMMMENFPLPIGHEDPNLKEYELTRTDYTEAHASSPMFAIDCEMCMTDTQKLELTHIAVVNENLDVIYEELVKPRNRIVNYLTRYSGITEEKLANVTKRLEEVQKDLQEILPSDSILIGHSLNSDLHAMKLSHPYIIDTSIIYNLTGNRQRKSKLAMLTDHFLGETIQTNRKGHSPSEDAVAAMKLVQLKLSKGFKFGDSISNDESPLVPECQLTSSIFNNSFKANKTVAIIGPEDTLANYERFRVLEEVDSSSYKTVIVKNPLEAVEKVEASAVTHNFSLAHIDLSAKLGQETSAKRKEKLFKKLDNWIDRIFSYVSLNGLCVVVFGGPKQPSSPLPPPLLKNDSAISAATTALNQRTETECKGSGDNNNSDSESSIDCRNNNNNNSNSDSSTLPPTPTPATVKRGSTAPSQSGTGTGTGTDSSTGDMEKDMKSKSKSEEVKEEGGGAGGGRRLNGAVFVRVKSPK